MNAYQKGQKLLCGDYSSYTPSGASNFKKACRWHTVPQYGDVVYFYSESLGRIAHVGIVTRVDSDKKLFYTIEGNTSSVQYDRNGGAVASHSYSYEKVGGKNRVHGFGRPFFDRDTCSALHFVDYAKSWTGYEEKASNGTEEQLSDKHWNPGKNNYTLFGKWYGLNPAQWCQMFVSYCAYRACAINNTEPSGWLKTEDGWSYRKDGGELARDEWLLIGGRWYVFDGAARMIKGWFHDSDGQWYYLAEDGAMLSSQWLTDKEKSYYLTSSGAMSIDCYIRSDKPFAPMQYIYYYVDSDGVWRPERDTEKLPNGADIAR